MIQHEKKIFFKVFLMTQVRLRLIIPESFGQLSKFR